MLKDKEYPATHSMSTCWYIADKDGNVGLMDYEDNGPIPNYDSIPQTCIEDNVLGCDYIDKEGIKNYNHKDFNIFQLSPTQLKPLLEGPIHNLKEFISKHECYYYVSVHIKISLNRNEDFKNSSLYKQRKNGFDRFIDISTIYNDKNSYYVFEFYYEDDLDNVLELIESNIIEEIYGYNPWNYDLKDFSSINSDAEYHDKIKDLPYYIYSQDYNPEVEQERIVVPKYPVKLSQIPENVRKTIPVLPFSFKDKEKFQISDWLDCDRM